MPMTGERLVPSVSGQIEAEHLHRYFLARDLCRGKRVLDIASGEGYGAALIAQTAESVIGVDIDGESVDHATRSYMLPNLRYLEGSATALPMPDATVDVVVSFETLEHFVEHDAFFAEVRRVLRPGGFMVISTPDANVYSAPGSAPNPFHMRELTQADFIAVLSGAFRHVHLYGQRIVMGSAILAYRGEGEVEQRIYERRDSATFESHGELPRARYVIAVAADTSPPALGQSLYIDETHGSVVEAELERLRIVEGRFADHVAAYADLAGEAERLRAELGRAYSEAEGLRSAEAAARDHVVAIEQRAATGEVLIRQQSLVMQRLRRELVRLGGELARLRRERDAVRGVTSLIGKASGVLPNITVRATIRRWVPERLRRYARTHWLAARS